MDIAGKLGELKAHYRDIDWWNGRLAKRVGARFFEYKPAGSSIWEEEWDSLIILDDCRYDLFRELWEGGTRPQRRISLGNSTPTFLRRNFPGSSYPHLVYVTANPYVDKILGGRLAGIVSVWETGWDHETNTVPPWRVCEAALEAATGMGGRKLVVHFLQPHSPYPNRVSEVDFKHNVDITLGDEQPRIRFDLGDGRLKVWPHYCWRRLDDRRIREGYRENLELVLPHARRLAEHLPGRTVITSDHGESIGERISPLLPLRVYGHPNSPRLKVTATVPWLVLEARDKRAGASLEQELARLRADHARRGNEGEKDRLRGRIAGLRERGLV
jgi:hypothetical protein